MIPADNPKTYAYIKEIALAAKDEILSLGSTNIRFYVVDVDIEAKAIKATLHWCCFEADPGIISTSKKLIADKIIKNTRFKTVIWE